ncbi:50S ribosomal protein L1 [Salinisphaera japonica]|uniref:Large ribosomal subunit protein uL1 n=1 Tax=Salinisphaera japonica YTM-1 TaxID=1209778 RepID=A0A423PIU0_9GAMM|nr:50S ribosomal protein L1 [Salinisphaera japonica]ROO25500.1 50S ribosomal protein L1 [Salinisphaera japonica YTM-1]|tara:strand:- start:128 stop:823 length:696 start_codon:yes stop_codon:yes gene_type:complete
MAKISKRKAAIRDQIDPVKVYPVDEALELLKKLSNAKFTETVEVSVNLGVNARKSDQNVRGSTVMPNGTGKSVRVAVFTQGANADAAKEAGADIVGLNDLAEQVQAGEINFDMVVATPDAMPVVGRLGQILGPKGLMPNPKTGTVTTDVTTAVKNAKAGQVQYRTDKAGIIHAAIGKVDFDNQALVENLTALIQDLKRAKPANAKGQYFRKVSLSTTMGPGLTVDHSGVSA